MASHIALTRFAAALLCLSGLSSCVRAEKFDQRLAEAQCKQLADCDIFPDADTCVQILYGDPQETYREQALDAGRMDYNSRQARKCIRAVKALGCTRYEDMSAVDEACEGIWQGNVQPDQPCFLSDECAGELSVCAFTPSCNAESCCEGICRYIPGPFALGEPCAPTDRCETGSFCRFPDSTPGQTGTCSPLAKADQACSISSDCVDDHYCRQGVCKALQTVGQSCQDAPCKPELYCSSEQTCKTRALVGEPCEDNNDDSCRDVNTICNSGTCVRLKAPGEQCEGYSSECVQYAPCDDGICTAYAMLGDPCDTVSCYYGLICIDDICQRLPGGEAEICAIPGES